ncbi:MAG TPA: hypothetical protein VFZ65_04310 [Planctomycetota bacterium]|nr:hypothetical protein [Planctomycetota bacterium]
MRDPRPNALAAACLLAAAPLALPAQAVHVVGPGGLPQIRDALAIAAPGDLVLVLPGSYAPFQVHVGVTIAAVLPGTVDVTIDPTFLGPCSPCYYAGITSLAPPPGQTLTLVDLAFTSTWVVFQGQYVYPSVVVSGGRVVFEGCTIEVTSAFFPALSVQHASVHLQDCTVRGFEQLTGITALSTLDADITAVGTTITRHATIGSLIGFGVGMTNSTLHGSHLALDGDTTAALSTNNSSVWLTDSMLRGPAGGCAVAYIGTPPQLDRCVLLPAPCGPFLPNAPLLGVQRPHPPRAGLPFSLLFHTVPNGFVAVFANTALDTVLLPGLFDQPLGIAPAGAFGLGIVLADAAGVATATWTIPAGTTVGRQVWFQGVTGLVLPLQTSPPVGGAIR